jgi:hypothetical protein
MPIRVVRIDECAVQEYSDGGRLAVKSRGARQVARTRQHEPATRAHEAGALVAAARKRLAAELGRLPEWGSQTLWALLRSSGRQPEGGVSSGALVHYLRCAAQAGDAARVRELFVTLLERTEIANRRWAAREAARCGLAAGPAAELREDLREELTERGPEGPWHWAVSDV